MIRAGILSDTHIDAPSGDFKKLTSHAFADCDIIIHAGDLIDISILSVFSPKKVHAVCGNSCNYLTRASLPEKKEFLVGGYTVGLCHGTGNRLNIEERMYDLFSDKQCVIFGHSHMPTITNIGETLLINPGTFLSSGNYGSPGTYGIIEFHKEKIEAKIHQLPTL